MMPNFPVRDRPTFWINLLLLPPAAASLRRGVLHGLARGQDLQWSGAHLAALGIDPYRQYLAGDPGHHILLAQVPNYLQELYLMLLPLGALRFETARAVWLGLNLLFLCAIVLSLRRMYGLGGRRTTLLLLVTLIGAPLRIALGNGQQSLLELLFFCLVFTFQGRAGRGLALGLSYAKYSFAPVLVVYLLLRRRLGPLLLSTIPVLAGLTGLWALVHGSLGAVALEPLDVSRTGVTAGLGDAMSLVWAANQGRRLPPAWEHALMYGTALVLSCLCAAFISRRAPGAASGGRSAEPAAAGMLATASLLCFTHLTYDYVFLMVPLAAGLAGQAGRWSRWVAGIVGCFWVVLSASGSVPDSRIPVLQAMVFCALAGMLLLAGVAHGESGSELEDQGQVLDSGPDRGSASGLPARSGPGLSHTLKG